MIRYSKKAQAINCYSSVLTGEQVRRFRNKLQLTQEQFAKVAGTCRANISGIETGKFGISQRVVKNIFTLMNNMIP